MTRFAQMMTDEEIKAAAQYFTAISATPWITVVERATVPKTKPENGMFVALEGDEFGFEPIGERIIETPEKTHDSEFLRNPRSGFIAYVPPGSLEKGAALVLNGITADGSKITACTVCHGGDLRGSVLYQRLPDARLAILSGSSTTCSVATGTGRGLRSWHPSLPTSARKTC